MSAKSKFVSLIMSFCLIAGLLVVGVFALKTANFEVGGDIIYNVQGVEMTIQQVGLNNITETSSDQNKMKSFSVTNSTTKAEVEEYFSYWQNLSLATLGEDGEASILVKITNNATEGADNYLDVNVTASSGTAVNCNVTIETVEGFTNAMINPKESRTFKISFIPENDGYMGSLTGFKVNFDIKKKNLTDLFAFTPIDDTEDTTDVSVRAIDYKKGGEIAIPSTITLDDVNPYTVTTIETFAFLDMESADGDSRLKDENLSDEEKLAIVSEYANPVKKLYLPSTITTVAEASIAFLSTLEEINIPEGLSSRGDMFGLYTFPQTIVVEGAGWASMLTSENVGAMSGLMIFGQEEKIYVPEGKTVGDYVTSNFVKTTSDRTNYDLYAKPEEPKGDPIDVDVNNYDWGSASGEVFGDKAVITVTTNDSNSGKFIGIKKTSATPAGTLSVASAEQEIVYLNEITEGQISAARMFGADDSGNWTNNTLKEFVSSMFADKSLIYNDAETVMGVRELIPQLKQLIAGIEDPTDSNYLLLTSLLEDLEDVIKKEYTVELEYTEGDVYEAVFSDNIDGTPDNSDADFDYTVFEDLGAAFINKYKGSSSEITLPTSYGRKSVAGFKYDYVSISEATVSPYFSDNITSLTIPDNYHTIPSNAFKNLTALKRLTISEGVTSIGDNAFSGCSGLESITIPASVTSIGSQAFYNCSGLKDVTIGNASAITTSTFASAHNIQSVTIKSGAICNDLFKEKTNLKTAILGEGVTSIGDSAFQNCWRLTTLVIPEGVTSIGKAAFASCNSLVGDIVIPEGVTTIGDSAFAYCRCLTSLTIPSGVTSIADNAFIGCGRLESIIVDANNANYDSRNNCNALIRKSDNRLMIGCKNTIIPNTVTSIGNAAFMYCSSLTSVIIPNTMVSIGRQAFYCCSNLTSITIPEGVTSIGEDAFSYTYKLVEIINKSSVTIETGSYGLSSSYNPDINIVTSESDSKITKLENFVFYKYSEKDYLVSYEGNETNITLPSDFDGQTYTIRAKAFYDVKLKSIEISEGVASIESSAFEGCSSLTDITICNASIITNKIFEDARQIENVTIYSGEIGNQFFFFNSTALKTVNLGEGVRSISYNAFNNCSGLESVIVAEGNTVYTSRDNNGNECNAIIKMSNNELIVGCKNTIIPSSVTSIGSHAFYGCSGLESITIPASVTSIGWYAFSDCSGLTSIKVAEGNTVYTSRDNNGNECNAIIKISNNELIRGCENTIIPSSVTSIGSFAFEGCSGLISIVIPEGVTSIGSQAFYNCNGLTSITIPDGVTSIGDWAFVNCSRLTYNIYDNAKYLGNDNNPYLALITATSTSITTCEINSNTKVLAEEAFKNCSSIASITIPSSVTSIGLYAFRDCSGLESIIVAEGNTVYTSRDNNRNECNAIIKISNNELIAGCKNTTIPEGVTSIGHWAFGGCSGLTSITIPSSVTSIGSEAFNDCSGLTSVIIDSEAVASMLTSTGYNVAGNLLRNSNLATIYFKEDIWTNNGEYVLPSYVTKNFTQAGSSDREGYRMYTKIS